MSDPDADTLVVPGATGDLAGRRIIPSLYAVAADGTLPPTVVGTAAGHWTTDRFREHARESATTHLDHPDGEVLTGLLDRLVYVGGTTAGGTRSTGWRSMPTGPRRCRCGSSGTARA